MDFSQIETFLIGLPSRDPIELFYIASGILASSLLFLYLIRGRRSRDGKPLVQKSGAAAAAPAPKAAEDAPAPRDEAPMAEAAAVEGIQPEPTEDRADLVAEAETPVEDAHDARDDDRATAESTADDSADEAPADDDSADDDEAPQEVITPVRPMRPAAQPLRLEASDAVVAQAAPVAAAMAPLAAAAMPAPAPNPDMADLGIYTPHFDFTDSDAFRDAIRAAREAQAELATTEGVTVPLDGAEAGVPSALERVAARAFTADIDVAIGLVRWNNIDQMEQRLERTQASLDATLASENRRINPRYAALKLQELRLTHEAREKQKEEKDLRAELARLKKEEMQLAKDAAQLEREEQQAQAALDRANAAAQRASGDEVFEHEAKVGELTRALEDAHQKAAQARTLVEVSTAGHLYVISNVGAFGEGVFKIGITRRPDPTQLIEELSQDSVPFPFDTHAVVYSENVELLRDEVYAAFRDNRVNRSGRHNGFISASLAEISETLARLAPQAEFYSAVEAQGYHETLAQMREADPVNA